MGGLTVVEEVRNRPSWSDRAKAGFVWFMVGGFGLGIVTVIPAAIVGFSGEPFHRFIYLSAIVVGIGGAIYGRCPPGLD